MSLFIKKIVVGPLATNCYLVSNQKKDTLIIDPGEDGQFIIEEILKFELVPKMILATHAHFDHILAAFELKHTFKIPFLLNKKDLFILHYANKSARFWLNLKNEPLTPIPEVDRFLDEGDQIKLGREIFQVLETPGHTPGSICLYCQKHDLLLSGDTLFNQGFGRTDLPGGSEKELLQTLKRIFKLSAKIRVLPGHGEETTLKTEKKILKNLIK